MQFDAITSSKNALFLMRPPLEPLPTTPRFCYQVWEFELLQVLISDDFSENLLQDSSASKQEGQQVVVVGARE